MAGLGFKDFAVGEVLTSADVDGYLMQQTVMRFADAGARGSALGTATGTAVPLAEGMVSYLDDVNRVEVYDGTLWKPTGSILQVVSAAKTNTFTTTSASFVDVTGLTLTITPGSTANKILLIAEVALGDNNNENAVLRFNGGNSSTYIGDAAGSRVRGVMGGYQHFGLNSVVGVSMVYLDSPTTTSPVTYAVQTSVRGGQTAYINRSADDSDSLDRTRGASSITAIEVAG